MLLPDRPRPTSPRPRRRTLPVLLALLAALATSLAAQSFGERPPRRSLPSDELTPAQREQLRRDKLIIGSKDYPQIFTPYFALGKAPDSIRFITSDAALAAYHALFEDSFRELELRRAFRLRSDLEKLYAACKSYSGDKKTTYPPALIQHILGPALVILGLPANTDNFSENLLPEINRQAALIRAAEIEECPPWLDYSKEDPFFKIDYRRCKPVSFYAGNPALADYHRAIRWLQLAPLRATNDDELDAWAHMVNVSGKSFWDEPPDFTASLTGHSTFVGPIADRTIIVDDLSILSACFEFGTSNMELTPEQNQANHRARLREVLLSNERRNPRRSAINDEIRLQPEEDAPSLSEIRFRVMPTHALPDAEILSACLAAAIHPNGLTVAAFFGSAFAHERMPKIPKNDDGSKWAAMNKRARYLMLPQNSEPRSLYADYIDVLRTLNAPPVKEAPAFMRGLPWQIKTCQTQLASWAQIRHTYALQAKLSVLYFGAMADKTRPPPGFVEPNPAFWREYIRLVERTISLLDKNSVFSPSPAEIAQDFRTHADNMESLGLLRDDMTLDMLQKPEIIEALRRAGNMLYDVDFSLSNQIRDADCFSTITQFREHSRQAIEVLRSAATQIEQGQKKIRYADDDPPLATRWDMLVKFARQLETILAKQLDEIDLTDSERHAIISFGYCLAHAMGYFASSSHTPRDDAPRWAEVAHDPNPPEQSLAAATGRARALHVLYPWRGRELLCTGAVLSYYEEWAPTKRLTDGEWKQKLDSPAAPPPPAWLAPILAK